MRQGGGMSVDLSAAADFLAGSARVLDRRRFDLLFGGGDPAAVLAAVDGYRNPDGGYGWGLEPDLRSRTSQPGGALHAFEVFADVAPVTTARAAELCDWLASVTPARRRAAVRAAGARSGRVRAVLGVGGRHASPRCRSPRSSRPPRTGWPPATRRWPSTRGWPGRPSTAWRPCGAWAPSRTRWCSRSPPSCSTPRPRHPGGRRRRRRAPRRTCPADGLLHVAGGADDEFMRPLDFAPFPGGPARSLFAPGVVEAELERLAAGQQPDGGWRVDFASYSPAATLEWRGHRTVQALVLLRANGVV